MSLSSFANDGANARERLSGRRITGICASGVEYFWLFETIIGEAVYQYSIPCTYWLPETQY